VTHTRTHTHTHTHTRESIAMPTEQWEVVAEYANRLAMPVDNLPIGDAIGTIVLVEKTGMGRRRSERKRLTI
jgi:hypothetical protein